MYSLRCGAAGEPRSPSRPGLRARGRARAAPGRSEEAGPQPHVPAASGMHWSTDTRTRTAHTRIRAEERVSRDATPRSAAASDTNALDQHKRRHRLHNRYRARDHARVVASCTGAPAPPRPAPPPSTAVSGWIPRFARRARRHTLRLQHGCHAIEARRRLGHPNRGGRLERHAKHQCFTVADAALHTARSVTRRAQATVGLEHERVIVSAAARRRASKARPNFKACWGVPPRL